MPQRGQRLWGLDDIVSLSPCSWTSKSIIAEVAGIASWKDGRMNGYKPGTF
jgi:hypothetical protein